MFKSRKDVNDSYLVVINLRPITFMSDGFEEAISLTPMFLQDIKEIGVLDLVKVEQRDMSKRFNYRLKLKEDLRERFRFKLTLHHHARLKLVL